MKNQGRQQRNNVEAFTLKHTSNNKTNKGSNVNRTEKQNVDQNTASKYCKRSLQKSEAGEKEEEGEGKWGRMKPNEHREKKRLYNEVENNDDNEGWRIRSARLLYPLPYLPNSVQTYTCNKKK